MTDDSILTWVRLPHGRLWHLQADQASDTALCGEGPLTEHCEQLSNIVPRGGRVCRRCVQIIHRMASLAALMLGRDPTQRDDPITRLDLDSAERGTPT